MGARWSKNILSQNICVMTFNGWCWASSLNNCLCIYPWIGKNSDTSSTAGVVTGAALVRNCSPSTGRRLEGPKMQVFELWNVMWGLIGGSSGQSLPPLEIKIEMNSMVSILYSYLMKRLHINVLWQKNCPVMKQGTGSQMGSRHELWPSLLPCLYPENLKLVLQWNNQG